jgi:hypothetical protein
LTTIPVGERRKVDKKASASPDHLLNKAVTPRESSRNLISIGQVVSGAKGVRTLSYVDTFLANVTSKPSGFTRNFYLEAVKEGRFVMKVQRQA